MTKEQRIEEMQAESNSNISGYHPMTVRLRTNLIEEMEAFCEDHKIRMSVLLRTCVADGFREIKK